VKYRAATVLAILVIVACGSQPVSSSHPGGPSAGPSASASSDASRRELLFAALEPGGDLTSMRDNVVAIVREDGTAKGRARFDARQLPKIGNALPLPQPEAHVAAGKVFFADGSGAIRSLSTDGTVANVTTIPLTSGQQVLSFSVSPDGSQVVAAVFSFPPVRNPPPQSPIENPFGPGDYTLQEWSAKSGQSPISLARRNWPQSTDGGRPPNDVLEVVGWSRDAPLATIDTEMGTQQGSLGRVMFGHVAELDAAGRPGPPLGGYSCTAWSVLPDQTVLCNDDNGSLRNFSVRSKDGTVRYRFQATGDEQYLDLSLSPDGARVAYLGNGGQSAVVDGTAKMVRLAANFKPEGWLNTTTLVGVVQTPQGEGNMALIRLDHPSRMEDLGFHGFFAGVVQGG
jgi:hypothetical protein